MSRCHAYAISGGLIRRVSTAAATTASASRNTRSSRRSISTRSPTPGASILLFAPARALMMKHARCSPRLTSRSGSEGFPHTRNRKERKYGEEEFDREEQQAAQDGKAICQPARKVESDRVRQKAADGGAFCGIAEAGGVAAQFVEDAHSQPLRAERAPACLLP